MKDIDFSVPADQRDTGWAIRAVLPTGSQPYHTASGSGTGETCVEVSEGPVVRVRDTKARDLGHLAVSGTAWTAFLAVVKTP